MGPIVRALEDVERPVSIGRPTVVGLAGWDLGWLVKSPGVGHPVQTGRPVAVDFWQLLLLVLVLGVLASSSIGCGGAWLSSKYLIMHSTHVGGSSHVSHVESESSERSEFTLCPMAYV